MVGSAIDYTTFESPQSTSNYILTVAECEEIADNSRYKLRDLYFTDKQGFIAYTISITNLRAGQQTRGHIHNDQNEVYRIQSGDGFIVLDGDQYRVKAGAHVFIQKGVYHKVVNASDTEEMVFSADFPGHLVRPGFVRKRS